EDRARAAVGERPDLAARTDAAVGEDAVGLDVDAFADDGVGEDAAGVDPRARADAGGAAERDARAELDVAADLLDVGVDGDGLGRGHGHALAHPALVDAAARDRVHARQVDAVVHAGDLVPRRGARGGRRRAGGDVGEVELALRVLGRELLDRLSQKA